MDLVSRSTNKNKAKLNFVDNSNLGIAMGKGGVRIYWDLVRGKKRKMFVIGLRHLL